MKVTRRMQIKTENFCVGDEISIEIKGVGKYLGTVEIVRPDRICVSFDNVICLHFMNAKDTTEGGYMKSEMRQWLYEVVAPSLPKKIQDRLISIELPTYGQVFGHDKNYKYYTEDNDEQLPYFVGRTNRICTDENDRLCWWWLQNTYCPDGEHGAKRMSSARFAVVYTYGYAAYGSASDSFGVRPVLWLAVKP